MKPGLTLSASSRSAAYTERARELLCMYSRRFEIKRLKCVKRVYHIYTWKYAESERERERRETNNGGSVFLKKEKRGKIAIYENRGGLA